MKYLIALASAFVASAQLIINTPQDVLACSTVPVTWTGGNGPYILQVEPSGNTGGPALETFENINSPSYSWTVIESTGTQVFLLLHDDNGFIAETPSFTIQGTGAYIPTNAAATTACLAGDRSIIVPDATNCNFLTTVLGVTLNGLYTVSGSNICCNSIPSGTTICVPTAAPPSCSTTTVPPTTTATQTSTTTATTTTTTTAAPSGPTNVSGYKNSQYLGCYVDSVSNRVLPNEKFINQVTVELCIDSCNSAGFAYAGLEYSGECYCGNTVPPTIATDGRCDMTCAGNSQEICGGGNGISVYSSGATASILPSYGLWTYTGCYEDSVAARTMPVTITTIDANSMTVEKCLDACYSRGYLYAGLEYAQECYCGSALPPTLATDGRCNMVCKGNDMEYCGGGNGLTVYTYQYSPPQSRRAF